MHTDVVGPVFTRIWDRPTSVFAERLKHVMEPGFSVNMTSRIADFAKTPVVSDVSEFVIGSAAQLTYGLTNRLFARGKDVGVTRGQTREFLTVGIQQTTYTNPDSIRYDSAYQSTFGNPFPARSITSGVDARGCRLRARTTATFARSTTPTASGCSCCRPEAVSIHRASFAANYSWRDLNDSNFMSASTTLRWLDGRANGTYSLSWDIARSYVVSQSIVGSYLAQCCGLQVEFQRFNYPEGSGIPIASDTRFNFGFVLAGLGTFSNFFGAFGGQVRSFCSQVDKLAFAGKDSMTTPVCVHERGGEAPAYRGRENQAAAPHSRRARLADGNPRADESELFTKFGQVYVSATYPGVVKAWHYHKVQVDNFACIAGMVKLVLVDTRDGSPTKGAVNEFFIGDAEPDAGAGPEPRLSRVEVHQHRALDGDQRAERAVPLRGSGRVPARPAPHAGLRLDAQRWLMSSSPAAPDSSAATSSATRCGRTPTGASRRSTS